MASYCVHFCFFHWVHWWTILADTLSSTSHSFQCHTVFPGMNNTAHFIWASFHIFIGYSSFLSWAHTLTPVHFSTDCSIFIRYLVCRCLFLGYFCPVLELEQYWPHGMSWQIFLFYFARVCEELVLLLSTFGRIHSWAI